MIYVETGSTDVYFNFATEYYFASEKKTGGYCLSVLADGANPDDREIPEYFRRD